MNGSDTAPATAPALGAPAPWFHGRALGGNPRYAFDTAGGRWILMLFAGSASQPAAQAALHVVADNRQLFDDRRAAFFGVTIDGSDVAEARIAQDLPGIRWFLDYDRAISTAYGAAIEEAGKSLYSPHWLLLDPALRIYAREPLSRTREVIAGLQRLVDAPADEMQAPVLVVPRVLPPELCRTLIDLYERKGGEQSGFMRDVGGITTTVVDASHKRRADCAIDDEALIGRLRARLNLALRPMVRRAFQFEATRIERWIVACYDARDGGHFRAHRDNTTAGTAHRKFACTINLNAGEYEGGDLCFPEFGDRTYRASTGGAVIFSCSLLHEARPVTAGRRYAFLPFLYDDEGARIREANLARVSPELRNYRSGLPE